VTDKTAENDGERWSPVYIVVMGSLGVVFVSLILVLLLGSGVLFDQGSNPPSASFYVDYDVVESAELNGSDTDGKYVRLVHSGGERIMAKNLFVASFSPAFEHAHMKAVEASLLTGQDVVLSGDSFILRTECGETISIMWSDDGRDGVKPLQNHTVQCKTGNSKQL